MSNSKFLIVPIDENMSVTATFLAEQRLTYEFPRVGYGQYQHNSHLENIRNGYLGELAFLKIITERIRNKYNQEIIKLNQNYNKDKAKKLYDKIKNEKFSWEAIIGQTDNGYDFKKDDYLIDVKTYGTDYLEKNNGTYKSIRTNKNINELNLYIDERQGKKWINNNNVIFVQAFIEKDLKNVIFAGYYIGLPPLNEEVKNPAYACLVENLKPMNELFQLLGV